LVSQQINNYEGKNLSSVNDIPENSIKGPQYVDKMKYRLEIAGLVGQSAESYPTMTVLGKFTKLQESRHSELRRGLEFHHSLGRDFIP